MIEAFSGVTRKFSEVFFYLWKFSENVRKRLENRQKRPYHYGYVLLWFYVTKIKLYGRAEIRNFSSRVEKYFTCSL